MIQHTITVAIRHPFLLSACGAGCISFGLNLIVHGSPFLAIANTLALLLTLRFALRIMPAKRRRRSLFLNGFVLLLGFLPLFTFQPETYWPTLFLLANVVLLEWLPIVRTSHRLAYWTILLLNVCFVFLGSLASHSVLDLPRELSGIRAFTDTVSIDKEKTIFFVPAVFTTVDTYRTQLVLPHRASDLVYTPMSVLTLYFLANVAWLANLKSLGDTLFFANLYPLALGINHYRKTWEKHQASSLLPILAAMVAVGIARSPDRFVSLYLIAPYFVWFSFLGASQIHKRVYAALFLLSVGFYVTTQL